MGCKPLELGQGARAMVEVRRFTEVSMWLSSSVRCFSDWRGAAYARNLEWKVMKSSGSSCV